MPQFDGHKLRWSQSDISCDDKIFSAFPKPYFLDVDCLILYFLLCWYHPQVDMPLSLELVEAHSEVMAPNLSDSAVSI
jgi:hypothetical protein